MIKIALPTGRVQKDAIKVLKSAGVPTNNLEKASRELSIDEGNFRFFLAKPMDVPLYVYYGTTDLALAGSDVLMEVSVNLLELADTGLGQCRLVVAGPWSLKSRFDGHEKELMWLRVATKYPNIAERHFASKGVRVEIIKLHGSVELAPQLNIADCIVDITQTGKTLEANDLIVLEEVCPVSLKLVSRRYGSASYWRECLNITEGIKNRVRRSKDV